MVELSDATDDELRTEVRKRGWAMCRPINITYDVDKIIRDMDNKEKELEKLGDVYKK